MTLQQAAAPPTGFPSGLSALAGDYDLIFCDVWGVLHNGVTAFPAASEALRRFRAGGGTVILISNAPRPGASVVGQLDRLGVPRLAYDEILTSGDLTRQAVLARPGESVLHLGPERDRPVFEGLPVRFADAETADYVVCSGLYDDETETAEDYRALLVTLKGRDRLMICANPDLVVERGHTLLPCAGAIAALYETLGGQVLYAGKPHPPIYEAALEQAGRLRGAAPDRSRVLAIGDALRTDIAGAARMGIDALFIARGIHTMEMGLGTAPFAALAGPWLARQAGPPRHAAEWLVW